MTPMKLKVLVAAFSYGGNGGISSEHPDVRDWMLRTFPAAKDDQRVASIELIDIADTPITMSRNRAVVAARQTGADVLIMVDSDMRPDCDCGLKPGAKRFWDSSFDFLYNHWAKGPVVIGAPYCGPPPNEVPYVFRWRQPESDNPNDVDCKLDLFTREEAAERTGFEQVAALPTGLIMFDVRAFELTEPAKPGDKPWFYYEYEDIYESTKASTEDVTATRDLAFAGWHELGYNPLYCNWYAWAGHWKPKCVGSPRLITSDAVGEKLAHAARNRLPMTKRRQAVKASAASEGDWPARDRNGHAGAENGSCPASSHTE
jgi:hypothetical protein